MEMMYVILMERYIRCEGTITMIHDLEGLELIWTLLLLLSVAGTSVGVREVGGIVWC